MPNLGSHATLFAPDLAASFAGLLGTHVMTLPNKQML
jgi:hypothetical protein